MPAKLYPRALAHPGKALAIALQISLGAAPAYAAQAATTQQQANHYAIDAGPLGSVLSRFAQAAGVAISFDSRQVEGHQSPGLRGAYSVDEGFAQVLAGSGFAAQFGEGGYTLVAAPVSADVVDLAPTQITANPLGNITEGTSSYTPGTIATATRMTLTPRETPQSITVVTRQHMDDFDLTSIDDVMRHTPGITVANYDSDRSNYYARGFSISTFQYDGIPSLRDAAYSAGQTLSDMAIYDRVEILKGATGLLTGAGGPGGTINLIRKKPTREFQGSIQLGAGSWDAYRSQIDVSGPLTETGNIRGRAVAAYEDKHSFLDHYQRQTSVLFGTLEADLSDDTLLTLGFDYQDSDPRGSSWSGTRTLFNSAGERISVPRSFNNGAKWAGWQQWSQTAFATLEHSLANDWIVKAQLNHQLNGYHAKMGSISNPPNVDTGLAEFYAGKYTGRTTTDLADVFATGPFSLFGREHQLVVGASASRAHWKADNHYNVDYPYDTFTDFYNWNGDIPEPDWGPVSYQYDQITRQTAGYITGRFSLADDLWLILGSRLTDYHLTGTTDAAVTGKVVPYVGLTYDINDNFSAYASYTSIFQPQGGYVDSANKVLAPDQGDNYEIGIKGEFFGGRLNSSLAYFEVHESDRAVEDDAYNANPTNPAVDWAYTTITAKTRGFEAELSGELLPGWQAQAGYTHKIIRDQGGDKVSTWEPQDQLSFFTSYRLKGPLDKLTLGGGARWQGKAWQSVYNRGKGRYEDFTQANYWVVDLMARYQVSEHLSATVNVNNLFDEAYYTNIGFYTSASYGDPRNLMFTTRYDF